MTLKTHTEGEIIKTDHDKHRYNIKYIDPKSGTMVKKWFSVNDVTSLTLDEEANRQKKAVKETSEKRTKHDKNKSKDTSTNTDASKTASKNDDDSTLSFELIEEGHNQKNETFKGEGSQLDKSVNEIVENRKLSGDTIGLYFDYLKQQDAVGAYIWAWLYYAYDTLNMHNCHHILPEKINPLLYLFAEPHSLYSMSQSTTIILSFHDNV